MDAQRPAQRRCTIGLLALVCLALADAASAATDCTRQCRRETATCVAQRCAGLTGSQRATCRARCRGLGGCAKISTLAYVLTECHSDARGIVGRQALRIRRGSCSPVTVMEIATDTPMPDPLGLCGAWGRARLGEASVAAGSFDRVAVAPDGTRVVFEVSDDLALFPLVAVPDERAGIYLVRSDGRGLRKLAPPSRLPAYLVIAAPGQNALGLRFEYGGSHIALSPDGRLSAFTDLGPDRNGEEAPQVVLVDLTSGARSQITRFPRSEPLDDLAGVRFLDDETIMVHTNADLDGSNPGREYRVFTMAVDGTGLAAAPLPVALPGARVEPDFDVVGGRRMVGTTLEVTGIPVNADLPGDVIAEAFALRGRRLVQLTAFGRVDTRARYASRDGKHIFLSASADPFGLNPSNNCQLFSSDPLGLHLSQLTRFRETAHSTNGCYAAERPGCTIFGTIGEDPAAGNILFYSSCDPLAANFFGGQLFAMRPNGTHLKQLTNARGMVVADDGSITVELPGPWAMAGRR